VSAENKKKIYEMLTGLVKNAGMSDAEMSVLLTKLDKVSDAGDYQSVMQWIME
jgi:hypothetical protein